MASAPPTTQGSGTAVNGITVSRAVASQLAANQANLTTTPGGLPCNTAAGGCAAVSGSVPGAAAAAAAASASATAAAATGGSAAAAGGLRPRTRRGAQRPAASAPPPPAPNASQATMMDSLQDAAGVRAGRRRRNVLRRRPSDEAVRVALARRFPSWDPSHYLTKEVGGKTLQQRLKEHRNARDAGGPEKVGKIMYLIWERMYRPESENTAAALVPAPAGDPVDEEMEGAVVKVVKQSKQNFDEVLRLLKKKGACSHADMNGFVHFITRLRPWTNDKHYTVVKNFLFKLADGGWAQKFPSRVRILSVIIDDFLCGKYNEFLDIENPQLAQFWQLYTPVVDLILDVAVCMEILDAPKNQRVRFKDDISTCVASTKKLGRLPSQDAAKDIIAQEIDAAYTEHLINPILAIPDAEQITADEVEQ